LNRPVLFDFDGVVADNMRYHAEAWKRIFAEYGIDLDPRVIFEQEGRTTRDVVRYVLARHGREAPPELCEKIAGRKEQLFLREAAIQPRAEAVKLIETLRDRGAVVGLVTGSPRGSLRKVIPDGVFDRFNVVVTADDVKNGKPDAEPYLKAAQKLGIDPTRCVVVENAPLGIQAAKAAGMQVIGITTTLPETALRDADEVVHDFEELEKRLVGKFSAANQSV